MSPIDLNLNGKFLRIQPNICGCGRLVRDTWGGEAMLGQRRQFSDDFIHDTALKLA